MRELVLRMERSERVVLRESREFREENRADHRNLLAEIDESIAAQRATTAATTAALAALTETTGAITDELREMKLDHRAARDALLRILDRLDPGDATA